MWVESGVDGGKGFIIVVYYCIVVSGKCVYWVDFNVFFFVVWVDIIKF